MSKHKIEPRANNPKSAVIKEAIKTSSAVKDKSSLDVNRNRTPNTLNSKGSPWGSTAGGSEERTKLLLKTKSVKPVLNEMQPIATVMQNIQPSEEKNMNDPLSIDPKLIEMSQLLFADATPLEGVEYDTLTELYNSSFKSEPKIKLK